VGSGTPGRNASGWLCTVRVLCTLHTCQTPKPSCTCGRLARAPLHLAWVVTSQWSTAKPLQVSLLCRWHVLRGCGTHMQPHPDSYLRTVPDNGVSYITVLGPLGRLGMHMPVPPTVGNQEQASCAQGSCFDEVSHRSGCNGDLGGAGPHPLESAPADGVAVVDSTHHGEHHVRCLLFALPLARHSQRRLPVALPPSHSTVPLPSMNMVTPLSWHAPRHTTPNARLTAPHAAELAARR
jgi:hypothetical protein